ncbi:HalOD1 output domain-containing protein [Halorubrum sp. DTA46]|uniref:HalOD1 output domain-containing protein n=1 Tax=Halorubrum sp. DTA46 TaxID=3402162 RepID=UPI003AAE8172
MTLDTSEITDEHCVTIIEAVAKATNRMPTDLPPLQDAIDSDALDTLLNGRSSSVVVSFRYADTDVSVNRNRHDGIEVQVDGKTV